MAGSSSFSNVVRLHLEHENGERHEENSGRRIFEFLRIGGRKFSDGQRR